MARYFGRSRPAWLGWRALLPLVGVLVCATVALAANPLPGDSTIYFTPTGWVEGFEHDPHSGTTNTNAAWLTMVDGPAAEVALYNDPGAPGATYQNTGATHRYGCSTGTSSGTYSYSRKEGTQWKTKQWGTWSTTPP